LRGRPGISRTRPAQACKTGVCPTDGLIACLARAELNNRRPSVGLLERSPVTEPLPANLYATLHTNRGDVRIQLFPNHAPKTVRNFVGLAEGSQEWQDPQTGQVRRDPFFDGLAFHRVIAGFMIQGGCPLGTGTGGPGYTFDDEIHPELTFTKTYLLAMANAGKRMGKGTNGSQFFITVAPTPHLQGKHTIFGEVADEDSRKVVDAIVATPTDPRDRPLEPVVLQRVTIERG
jgi:peptidyl-prolyl cis-trans isomerase A (cyclophilin A)